MAELKKEGTVKKILVTGCLAERYQKQLKEEIPEIDGVMGIGANSDIVSVVEKICQGEEYESFRTFADVFGPRYHINAIIGIIFSVGLFMFGNLLFKTHKTAKTLACVIGISYVISMLTQLFLVSSKIYPWLQEHAEQLEISDVTGLVSSTMTFSIILNVVLTIGLYIGLYFKLKTQKY
jgi:uncharacterized membrane protein